MNTQAQKHEDALAQLQERGQRMIRTFKGIAPVPVRTTLYHARRKDAE
jgi:hypothetical protein